MKRKWMSMTKVLEPNVIGVSSASHLDPTDVKEWLYVFMVQIL